MALFFSQDYTDVVLWSIVFLFVYSFFTIEFNHWNIKSFRFLFFRKRIHISFFDFHFSHSFQKINRSFTRNTFKSEKLKPKNEFFLGFLGFSFSTREFKYWKYKIYSFSVLQKKRIHYISFPAISTMQFPVMNFVTSNNPFSKKKNSFRLSANARCVCGRSLCHVL